MDIAREINMEFVWYGGLSHRTDPMFRIRLLTFSPKDVEKTRRHESFISLSKVFMRLRQKIKRIKASAGVKAKPVGWNEKKSIKKDQGGNASSKKQDSGLETRTQENLSSNTSCTCNGGEDDHVSDKDSNKERVECANCGLEQVNIKVERRVATDNNNDPSESFISCDNAKEGVCSLNDRNDYYTTSWESSESSEVVVEKPRMVYWKAEDAGNFGDYECEYITETQKVPLESWTYLLKPSVVGGGGRRKSSSSLKRGKLHRSRFNVFSYRGQFTRYVFTSFIEEKKREARPAGAVLIRAKKCDGMMQPEYKKFCVDPQLTSFEVLQNLLCRAFNVKGCIAFDFTISYLAKDDTGKEMYLSLLSDWDLDAAFLSASDPCLRLKLDLKPFEEGLEDWDIIAPSDIPQHRISSLVDKNSLLGSITGTITSQVGKAVSQVQQAIGLQNRDDEAYRPLKAPMCDAEFHNYMNSGGMLISPQEFRLNIYQGGVEPSLRRVVWRHLLNVYPEGMTGQERFDYMKLKSREYYKLRDEWREQVSKGHCCEEIKKITNMVKKDVLRTDRTHKFYAGSDENTNVLALFDILVTFSLTHPEVGYCQGMSDIASPILVTQKDEAQAYICFCGIMKRLKYNFMIDGHAMTIKFQHLSELLQHHDPEFYMYLKDNDAGDMFFCYRWLLLEMKREFPFDDALHMLEVMWSSLPPDPPENGIELCDPHYSIDALTLSPSSPCTKESAYVRLRALRRMASHQLLKEGIKCNGAKPAEAATTTKVAKETRPKHHESLSTGEVKHQDEAITPVEEDRFEDSADYPMTLQDSMTRSLLERSSSIDRSLETDTRSERQGTTRSVDHGQDVVVPVGATNGAANGAVNGAAVNVNAKLNGSVEGATSSKHEEVNHEEKLSPVDRPTSSVYLTPESELPPKTLEKSSVESTESDVNQNQMSPNRRPTDIPIKQVSGGQSGGGSTISGGNRKMESLKVQSKNPPQEISSCEEAKENPSIDFSKVVEKLPRLPPPHEFGHGNPFLMFLCLTLLLQHRDHIMHNHMDYNDLAMHFDRMVRRHNVYKVLHQAQSLYAEYLRAQSQPSPQEASSTSSEDLSV